MIVERGEAGHEVGDRALSASFAGVETVPGLTWPTLVFEKEMTLWLGKLEVRIAHLGAGHTKGDTVVWLPSQKVLFFRRSRRVRRGAAIAATHSSSNGPRRSKRCAR